MRCFEERLLTFKDWHNPFIRPVDLAKAGLFYTKNSDRVECDDCGVQLALWSAGDDPLLEHKKFSPNCPFVKGVTTGVIPEEDTCGMYGIRPHERKRFETGPLVGPRFPEFTTKEDRLATFKNWPKSLKQTPEALAEAGFFYMNVGDNVACFYCAVGCKSWEEHDIPWVEHAKWSPDCLFLQLHKGLEFARSFKPEDEKPASVEESTEEPQLVEQKVRNEDATTDNKATCKVCYDKEVGVVFVPCGHAACLDCAPALTKCHICRTAIERFIRIYIS